MHVPNTHYIEKYILRVIKHNNVIQIILKYTITLIVI